MSSTPNPSGKLNPRNFPRPPLCERTPRHLEVKWNGQTIADTREGYWVLETYHPPTYYLPPSSLKVPLSKNSRTSYCEWKGVASYYDLANPGDSKDVAKARIWVIPQPGDFYGGWTTSDIDTTHVKGAPGTRHW
ncbi:hypothetical protein CERZMDRAFT_44811 [Cercospora zeae-maydis SCOH1-5]|uniref:DUF427 domain-containing protein n=1 Tax=Cercospora zeae-maydis SCOH1-5 TaxID=717836 RepID=A0A6A6FB12_9PEZI|nr:hypothetical protein CERZMDRAFT_44811 [Cercospora zeae-maydis SCOH1-5]